MWVDEIEEIRSLSRMPDGQAWTKHYGEMCKKTVARRHSKVLPMSSDLDDLLRRDDEPDAAGVGPAVQPRPGRNLTDALNMIASLPEGGAPDTQAGDDGDQAIERAEPDLLDVDHQAGQEAART